MRKIKTAIEYKVPSWNFCNHDGATLDHRFSKELCRFCVSSKKGYYCSLHDEWLASDPRFVHKTTSCIQATAGFSVSIQEPEIPVVDPQLLITEAVKAYTDTVNKLIAQGYPRALAEKVAMQYLLTDK